MNSTEVTNAIWEKCAPFADSKHQVEQVVKITFEVITELLKKQNDVKIRGFGTFKMQASKTIQRKMPGSSEIKNFTSKPRIKFSSTTTL